VAGVTVAGGAVEIAGNPSAVHPWASVTKLCTALAILVAVEEGSIALDEPAGPPGSSVRHLLAHASGLGPQSREQPLCPPATRRIYSNAGFELLGEVLEQRTGMSFAEYLAEAVFRPLDMSGTTIDGSPASGVSGPLVDLLRLGRELLRPTLVAEATMFAATTVVYADLAGVLPGFGRQDPCDWGLGFELKGRKTPHWTGSKNSPATFGHFGMSGSFLWVDPVAGLACASIGEEPFGSWSTKAWPALSDAVLAAQ